MSYEPRSYDPYTMEKKLNECVGSGGIDPSAISELQTEIDVLGSQNSVMAQDIVDIKGSLNSISNIVADEVEVGTYLGVPKYRKVINFGSLPNTTSKSVDIGVTIDKLVSISAIATDGTTYIQLPTPASSAQYIVELSATSTQIVCTTGRDASAFSAVVTIEYTKPII